MLSGQAYTRSECNENGATLEIRIHTTSRCEVYGSTTIPFISNFKMANCRTLCALLLIALVAQVSSQQPHFPGEHDYIKVDVELVQLLNPQGLTSDGLKCDSTNECDPKITAYLDTDMPLMAWPGGKAESDYDAFATFSNTNSPVINKNISKNICGGSINKVNLRVHIVDEDPFSSKAVIDDFECLFVADYGLVHSSFATSEWSATQDCRPLRQNNKVRLQYRHRLYDIPPSECGIKSSSGTVVRH